MNPLLHLTPLPEFSKIRPEHIKPAVEQSLALCRQVLEEVASSQGELTWQSLVMPLDECGNVLSRLWSPVSHLNAVCNSDELRDAYESCLPILSEYSTYVGQHEGLYTAYQTLADSAHYQQLTVAQKKVIDNTLIDFKLSGIGLSDEKKQRYGEIQARLSDLSSKYSNNVMDATLAWTKLITDESELKGLPESALMAAAEAAQRKELTGWLFTLDFPSFYPIMAHCENRQLREEVYVANITRASDQGPHGGQWDNSALMNEMLALKCELAKILGYENYAQLSLATKMADSTEQVVSFLRQLAQHSKKQSQRDFAELCDFARTAHGVEQLKPWDIAYYSELLQQQKYAISDEQLRPYFPEHKVVAGLFETVKRLYGITVQPRDGVEVWHEDVKYYEIFDDQGELRGGFYFDLYAREKKRGGAWMDSCVDRYVDQQGQLQTPVAYLVCNFNRPVGGKPALFTHNEVTTLFHEFGHGLQHLLTKVDVIGVSGINGVPWDAVELPSQFLENWCWQPEALSYLSGHYESGEPLPQDMLDKMLAARNFQSAMMMVRQIEFSLFDFRIHSEITAEDSPSIQQILNEVRDEVAVMKAVEFNRFQNSFNHIFSGGYAAGYYSYKWAEVLSADAFSRFEEEGIFNPKTGADFMQNILETGGSAEPMALYKAFRGREPSIDALLRHSGIEEG